MTAGTKTLTLLRHAKSGWDDPALRDYDRGLNAKGKRAAALVGGHLRSVPEAFDHVVASPAVRVVETLAQVESGYGRTLAPQWDRRIYLASAVTLLDIVHETPADATHLLSRLVKRYISYAPLRPFLGGALVAEGRRHGGVNHDRRMREGEAQLGLGFGGFEQDSLSERRLRKQIETDRDHCWNEQQNKHAKDGKDIRVRRSPSAISKKNRNSQREKRNQPK